MLQRRHQEHEAHHPRHDVTQLPRRSTRSVCIIAVTPSTPNVTIGQTVFEGGPGGRCTTEGDTFAVYLLNVSNCTVNLLITYSVDGGPAQVAALKSGNIPNGNTAGDCLPDAVLT